MGRALSGLQLQVLHLYRQALRAARKQEPHSRRNLEEYARHQFETQRSVSRTNVLLIEHLLRQGNKQLQMLSQTDVKGFTWKKE
jgi:hypothetical protein